MDLDSPFDQDWLTTQRLATTYYAACAWATMHGGGGGGGEDFLIDVLVQKMKPHVHSHVQTYSLSQIPSAILTSEMSN